MNSKILLSSMILGLTVKILKYGNTSSTASLNFYNFGALVFQELDTKPPGSLVSTSHQCFRCRHLNKFFDDADFQCQCWFSWKVRKVYRPKSWLLILHYPFVCLLDTLICLFHPKKFIESILLVSFTYLLAVVPAFLPWQLELVLALFQSIR